MYLSTPLIISVIIFVSITRTCLLLRSCHRPFSLPKSSSSSRINLRRCPRSSIVPFRIFNFNFTLSISTVIDSILGSCNSSILLGFPRSQNWFLILGFLILVTLNWNFYNQLLFTLSIIWIRLPWFYSLLILTKFNFFLSAPSFRYFYIQIVDFRLTFKWILKLNLNMKILTLFRLILILITGSEVVADFFKLCEELRWNWIKQVLSYLD